MTSTERGVRAQSVEKQTQDHNLKSLPHSALRFVRPTPIPSALVWTSLGLWLQSEMHSWFHVTCSRLTNTSCALVFSPFWSVYCILWTLTCSVSVDRRRGFGHESPKSDVARCGDSSRECKQTGSKHLSMSWRNVSTSSLIESETREAHTWNHLSKWHQ